MTQTAQHRPTSVQDLKDLVGTRLGPTEWHVVDQAKIDAFADLTGDHQWIHVDPVRAADGPYGATIAHGYLTLSLLPALTADLMDIRGFAMMINYGLEKLRFPAAVPVGSRIRAGIELTSLQRRSSGVQLNSVVTVEIEGGERPALVAETVRLMVE